MRVRYRFSAGRGNSLAKTGLTPAGHAVAMARKGLVSATLVCVLGLATATVAQSRADRQSGDQIIPDTAKAFVSIPDPAIFREAWKRTELGRLFHDPMMDDFGKSLRSQIENQVAQTEARLGLKMSDLEGVAGGEIAFAMVQPAPQTRFSIAVLTDVRGRDEQVKELQDKVRAQMARRGGTSKREDVEGYPLTVWTFPPTKEHPATTTAIFCQHADWYVAGDHLPTLIGMLHRIDGRGNDVLAKSSPYRAVMAGCQGDALAAHLKWFIEPFGLAESIREANTERERGRDKLKILKEQGFGAIEGIGGVLSLGSETFDTTYHAFVYAPADARVLAARMLAFPSTPKLALPEWAVSSASGFLMGNWEMRGAFEASKTLVDALSGSDVFEDALRDIERDANGLRVNIRKEFIAHLGSRVYMLSENGRPITPQSEQRLMAFELTDAPRVAATLERSMPRDPNVKPRKFGTNVVWEIIRKENVQLGGPQGGFQGFRPNKNNQGAAPQAGRPLFKNGAMAVAFGHLFYASDVEFLGKFITTAANQPKLASDPDYQKVDATIRKLGQQEGEAIRYFVRTDAAFETDYELFRQGKMVDNESLLGQLLNYFLAPDEEGLKRKQKFDGSKLPPFAQVRQYFQPGGMRIINATDGWEIVGGLLARDQRRAARN